MTSNRYPESGLAALLDALERELLAAQRDEVRAAWRGTGRARNIARQEVRALLNEAIAASEQQGSAAALGQTLAPEPDRIGFFAFRGSFDPRLAAILAPALFLLGAAAGTNGESRFCQPE